MNIIFEAINATKIGKRLSDVTELSLGPSGLRIVVTVGSNDGDEEFIELLFPHHRGHRYLDEGDLLRYWNNLPVEQHGYVVFVVAEGGWMDQERKTNGMLTTTDAVDWYREWFVCTSNGCVNVISKESPLLRRFG